MYPTSKTQKTNPITRTVQRMDPPLLEVDMPMSPEYVLLSFLGLRVFRFPVESAMLESALCIEEEDIILSEDGDAILPLSNSCCRNLRRCCRLSLAAWFTLSRKEVSPN